MEPPSAQKCPSLSNSPRGGKKGGAKNGSIRNSGKMAAGSFPFLISPKPPLKADKAIKKAKPKCTDHINKVMLPEEVFPQTPRCQRMRQTESSQIHMVKASAWEGAERSVGSLTDLREKNSERTK